MNNTPDYNDNLFFEEKMDCKNCPYTDEYCASGDCNEIQAKDIPCNKTSLTEKCKKGELPEGEYYIECKDGSITTMYLGDDEYSVRSIRAKGFKILAPVPSYEEWKEYQELYEDYKRNVQLAIRFSLEAEILKALLKECFEYIDWTDGTSSPINQQKLLDKIDEVLK